MSDTTLPSGKLHFMTTTWFGVGMVERLADELAALRVSRPLLVTDHGLTKAGVASLAQATVPDSVQWTTYDGTPSNPTVEAVEQALDLYRRSGCDGIVALGGGSPIDLAKAVALLARQEGALEAFDITAKPPVTITFDVAPLIAIPTTAGTGSEVGRAAVISAPGDRKLIIVSLHLIPRVVLADPALTSGLPAGMTAGTGMDAMTHCIEGFLAPNFNPPAAAVALDGIRRLSANIRRAVEEGSDLEARAHMMLGSLEGGMSMANGLGGVHAMSHAAGAIERLHLHHGTLNAVLLPPVLRYNHPAVGERYGEVLAAMGQSRDASLDEVILELNASLGLPIRLGAMGVTEDLLPALAERAAVDFTARTNPRQAGREAYFQLFREAL
ncbi:MAG: iron-containing alcohol dehydrogenase [Ectothiorhodospiraceae bacterium]|nr:iron-containing alcohol dehydrogenase [Ectothiorhodospiraceae bacterium]